MGASLARDMDKELYLKLIKLYGNYRLLWEAQCQNFKNGAKGRCTEKHKLRNASLISESKKVDGIFDGVLPKRKSVNAVAVTAIRTRCLISVSL